MWWSHLLHLLVRSWGALVKSTGTTTLGFIVWTLALTAVGWAATVAGRWFELKRGHDQHALKDALLSSRWPGIFLALGVAGLVFIAFDISLVATIYDDHQWLATENHQLRNAPKPPCPPCSPRILLGSLTKITFVHDLKTMTPTIECFDAKGAKFEYGGLRILDQNTVLISDAVPVPGGWCGAK